MESVVTVFVRSNEHLCATAIWFDTVKNYHWDYYCHLCYNMCIISWTNVSKQWYHTVLVSKLKWWRVPVLAICVAAHTYNLYKLYGGVLTSVFHNCTKLIGLGWTITSHLPSHIHKLMDVEQSSRVISILYLFHLISAKY